MRTLISQKSLTRHKHRGDPSPRPYSGLFVSLGALVIGGALSLASCTGQILSETDGEGCVNCSAGTGGSANPGSVVNPDNNDNPPGIEGIGWTTRFPRLSHMQWENTVRDLLRLDSAPGIASTFSLDPDGHRFDTYSATLVSSNLWTDYQRGAETLAKQVAEDPEQLSRIVPEGAPNDAKAFVAEMGKRAFRRPLSESEIDTYVALFNQGQELLGKADAFASGVEMVLRALLQSPNFLYRIESSTKTEDQKIWLNGYEVASRLSYALWNTMPSDELLAAAGNGELDTAEGVATWTRRMLDDAKATATIVAFHEQLFNVAEFGTIAKNQTLFPNFTSAMEAILQDEARLFFEEVVVKGNGGIASILTQPVTFVNELTAPLYGVSGNFGAELQRVDLDPSRRAGILTHVGFLSKFASQTQSDPILRGVHTLLDILCSDLPAPPPGIPPLPEIKEGQTNRQRVTAFTKESPCNGCHENHINPLGFAFENYDAVGAWRDTDNGQPVDAAATFELDGVSVSYENGVELSNLLAQSPTVHACYSKNWLEYMLGRAPSIEEVGTVSDLAAVSHGGATLTDLMAAITSLETFRARPEESVSP